MACITSFLFACLAYEGRIHADFHEKMEAAIKASPAPVSTLVVASYGGSLNAAMQTAAVLNKYGVELRVEDDCASACAIMWAATNKRSMGRHGRIGLHTSIPGNNSPMNKKVTAVLTWQQKEKVLRNAGIPDSIIEKAKATPAKDMLWLTKKELP